MNDNEKVFEGLSDIVHSTISTYIDSLGFSRIIPGHHLNNILTNKFDEVLVKFCTPFFEVDKMYLLGSINVVDKVLESIGENLNGINSLDRSRYSVLCDSNGKMKIEFYIEQRGFTISWQARTFFYKEGSANAD